jgi:hypothetical protein
MTVANVSQANNYDLPQTLKTAQDAMHLPEVQEILKRLSKFKLGIFMPHMHDEKTGGFQQLADDVMQVESGLQVSFKLTEEIANQNDRFLPVAWFWRGGATSIAAACEMVWDISPDEKERRGKHNMMTIG